MTTRAGGEVDCFCGKCKMVLAHTVLAMVGSAIARVQCNTCGSDHAFRKGPSGTTAAAARLPRSERSVLSFAAQIEARGAHTARAYSPKATFQVDELISHPTFGLGIVRAVRRDKVDVVFKAAERTLIQGRGGGEATPENQQPAES